MDQIKVDFWERLIKVLERIAVALEAKAIVETLKQESTASGHPVEKVLFDEDHAKVAASNEGVVKIKQTDKFTWYHLGDPKEFKVRKCGNSGCPYFLKYNSETKKYEHWKFDIISGERGFVDDRCDFYEGGS